MLGSKTHAARHCSRRLRCGKTPCFGDHDDETRQHDPRSIRPQHVRIGEGHTKRLDRLRRKEKNSAVQKHKAAAEFGQSDPEICNVEARPTPTQIRLSIETIKNTASPAMARSHRISVESPSPTAKSVCASTSVHLSRKKPKRGRSIRRTRASVPSKNRRTSSRRTQRSPATASRAAPRRGSSRASQSARPTCRRPLERSASPSPEAWPRSRSGHVALSRRPTLHPAVALALHRSTSSSSRLSHCIPILGTLRAGVSCNLKTSVPPNCKAPEKAVAISSEKPQHRSVDVYGVIARRRMLSLRTTAMHSDPPKRPTRAPGEHRQTSLSISLLSITSPTVVHEFLQFYAALQNFVEEGPERRSPNTAMW